MNHLLFSSFDERFIGVEGKQENLVGSRGCEPRAKGFTRVVPRNLLVSFFFDAEASIPDYYIWKIDNLSLDKNTFGYRIIIIAIFNKDEINQVNLSLSLPRIS